MGIVSAIPEKCKRCYVCVRECPAKAIKVENGQALVIEDRCIACGNCVKVCTQKAKRIEDSIMFVEDLLAKGKPVFACLAPSFPAAFHWVAPGKVISAVRKLGFKEVWNVAFGAELVAREYAKLFSAPEFRDHPMISTPCPAVVSYIEKFVPRLRGSLAPIVSPMIATARAIRHIHGAAAGIVFIGPCIAKKNEIRDPFVTGTVDAVLTFRELVTMLEYPGIELDDQEESTFDGPPANVGGTFPFPGGLLKTSGLSADILNNEVIVVEGKDRALAAIKEMEEGTLHARFLDVLFCEGCISGPKMLTDMGAVARRELFQMAPFPVMPRSLGLCERKEILANYVLEEMRHFSAEKFAQALEQFKEVDLGRAFTAVDMSLPHPSEENISRVLTLMRKYDPSDQLNCGACGYPTCREKAIAVCQGLAEANMCLPYLVDELEETCTQLQDSHQQLAAAQQRLVQTEKMASMGQLSAGVTHELNNPLGTILIYAHMLLRMVKEGDPIHADLEMITSEAMRCKNIVRGLLDFSRQSRVSKTPTHLAQLFEEVVVLMAHRAETANVRLCQHVDEDVPVMMLDQDQIKQVLLNLVGNGIDAADDGGNVAFKAQYRPDIQAVAIEVADDGIGIPEEDLSKLFTPFFTTKEMGKGTGLGLAIAYGIIKMHCGDVSVRSKVGEGTTFTILLPVESPESPQ